MVLGLWDGRLRRAAALVSVEQTFDNLPSNETIICVVGVVLIFWRPSGRSVCISAVGMWMRKRGNGGTRAATRATLIFVHMLRTYPSLTMHAGFSDKTGQESNRNVGLIERRRDRSRTRHSLGGRLVKYRRCTRIHIEFPNAMHDQLGGGQRQRHMICPTGGPLLCALVMAFGLD